MKCRCGSHTALHARLPWDAPDSLAGSRTERVRRTAAEARRGGACVPPESQAWEPARLAKLDRLSLQANAKATQVRELERHCLRET
jgi:hypothetical protein